MNTFEIDGVVFYYTTGAEFIDIKYDKLGEPQKASRMIHFFDSSKQIMDSLVYYDTIENVTNITDEVARKVFQKEI